VNLRPNRSSWERGLEAVGGVVLVLACAGVVVETQRSMADEAPASTAAAGESSGGLPHPAPASTPAESPRHGR
jgi:hypothetical protein